MLEELVGGRHHRHGLALGVAQLHGEVEVLLLVLDADGGRGHAVLVRQQLLLQQGAVEAHQLGDVQQVLLADADPVRQGECLTDCRADSPGQGGGHDGEVGADAHLGRHEVGVLGDGVEDGLALAEQGDVARAQHGQVAVVGQLTGAGPELGLQVPWRRRKREIEINLTRQPKEGCLAN